MFWDEICFFVPNIYDLFPSKNFITNSCCDFQNIPKILKIGIQKSKSQLKNILFIIFLLSIFHLLHPPWQLIYKFYFGVWFMICFVSEQILKNKKKY